MMQDEMSEKMRNMKEKLARAEEMLEVRWTALPPCGNMQEEVKWFRGGTSAGSMHLPKPQPSRCSIRRRLAS